MNIKVKDKHEFIDLATYGSQARQEVHPEVYIGSEHLPPFKEGDLLDAGATYSLMQQAIRSNLNLHWFETNDEFLIHLHAGDIGENDICFIVDIAAIYKAGQAIGWLDKSQLEEVETQYQAIQDALVNSTKLRQVTEAQYEEIRRRGEIEQNVLYLIPEEE